MESIHRELQWKFQSTGVSTSTASLVYKQQYTGLTEVIPHLLAPSHPT